MVILARCPEHTRHASVGTRGLSSGNLWGNSYLIVAVVRLEVQTYEFSACTDSMWGSLACLANSMHSGLPGLRVARPARTASPARCLASVHRGVSQAGMVCAGRTQVAFLCHSDVAVLEIPIIPRPWADGRGIWWWRAWSWVDNIGIA